MTNTQLVKSLKRRRQEDTEAHERRVERRVETLNVVVNLTLEITPEQINEFRERILAAEQQLNMFAQMERS